MTALSLTSRLYARLRANAREQRLIQNLRRLDDHTLRDIGLPRSAIPFAASERR